MHVNYHMPQTIYQISNKQTLSQIFPKLNPQELPTKIFYQGDIKLLESKQPKIAIVGSRTPSMYAQKVIQNFIPDIASRGFTIVSGGAFGVDILSQSLAANFTNKLITVLGSGLQHWAPKSNIKYFENFLELGGTIISPFENNLKPTKYTFVQRNQVIASMVDLVLIIEAGPKSGSLHTAIYATEQGIPVACFPSNIFQQQSIGCNNLIKQGAHLINCLDDIFDLIPAHKIQLLQKPTIQISQTNQSNTALTEVMTVINNSLNF